MKLPVNKRKELEKKGKREPASEQGGSALGRLRQFERERGLEGTELSNPADSGPEGEETKEEGGPGEDR